MAYQHLTTKREGPVEHVTLNRPEVRNAFNEEVIAELMDWATQLGQRAAREGVRVAVLAGSGKSFCAGADVAWMAKTVSYTARENLQDATEASRMFAALDALSVPLIGRVQGAAIGGGAGLCAVCDIVVAGKEAMFGFTEVKLGILPAVIAPFALAKIGRSAARELFLTGTRFSAARAREVGLVHAVVPADELDLTVSHYVQEILTAAPGAIAAAKSLIANLWAQSVDEATPITATAIATRRVSAEGQEGLRAFLEKRPPAWIVTKDTVTKDTRVTKDTEEN
jgi:methylglutaconyl-CoA hydratase